MPLANYRKAKDNVREKMSVENVLDGTSIFNSHILAAENGKYLGINFDEDTANLIKDRFREWFDNWIKDDLELITR